MVEQDNKKVMTGIRAAKVNISTKHYTCKPIGFKDHGLFGYYEQIDGKVLPPLREVNDDIEAIPWTWTW